MTTRALSTDRSARQRKWGVLGIELRRSTAPVAAALALVLGLASVLYLLSGLEPPFRQWTSFSGLLRDTLEFLCPVAIGTGAWQGRRENRPEAAELIATTARPTWQRVLPVSGALAIALTVAYLLVFAFGAVQVAGNTTYQHLDWLPILLVGALSLIAAGWLGLGIGTLLPSVFTAPMLTVISLAGLRVLAFAVSGKTALLGPELHFRGDLLTLAPQVSLAQAFWFAALAAGGLVLAMATGRRRYLAVLVIGAGLAVALPLFPATRSAASVVDAGAAEPVCTSDAPRVCVTKIHAGALAEVTGPARDALRLLAPLAAAPTSVAENASSPTTEAVKPQPSDVVLFDLRSYEMDEHSRPTVSRENLLFRFLEGAGTTECPDIPSDEPLTRESAQRVQRDFAARELAGGLLLGKPVDWFSSKATQAWPALHALPAAEQQRRLSAERQALLSCHGDPLDILTQGVTQH